MIDYKLLGESIDFYESDGFKRIESPWTVTEEVIDITRPPFGKTSKLVHEDGKCLVASGEQSFLYLYLKGFLPLGKFQTITPCFRSDHFDFTHTKYFIKNELIWTENPNRNNLTSICNSAMAFFSDYFNEIRLKETGKDMFDIDAIIDGKSYELGSYGIRDCEFLTWIYGTGLAEPRTSSLLNLQNKRHGIPQSRNT